MATVNKFEDLKVWQKSRLLCQNIFEIISAGEFKNDYALINQISRSSGSIMDNIAEGFGRLGSNEFINFLTYSNASANECKSQLYRAFDRKYIPNTQLETLMNLIDEITKMISSLIIYLGKTDIRGAKFKIRDNKSRHK